MLRCGDGGLTDWIHGVAKSKETVNYPSVQNLIFCTSLFLPAAKQTYPALRPGAAFRK